LSELFLDGLVSAQNPTGQLWWKEEINNEPGSLTNNQAFEIKSNSTKSKAGNLFFYAGLTFFYLFFYKSCVNIKIGES